MRVLLVEDDAAMTEMVWQALVSQHYQVDVAADGRIGWEFAEVFAYDLILLDLILPHLDGIRFCQKLRTEESNPQRSLNRHTPIMLMTAQSASTDKVAALDAGADDYLVKPFDFNELLARMRALLRRGGHSQAPLLQWGTVQLDPSTCEVTIAGQPIRLSPKEYNLLELFLRSPKRIFSHNYLIEHLWTLEEIPTENTVRAHIKGLRKKLKEAGATEIVETIYGLGYRLRENPESWSLETPEIHPKLTAPKLEKSSILSDSLRATAQTLFAQHREGYCQRLAIIEQAIAALNQQELSEELREQAWREAHTLKGSLGLFEMDEASQLAWKIEQILKQDPTRKQIEQLKHQVSELKQILSSESPFSSREKVDSIPQKQPATLWIVGEDKALVEQFRQAAAAQPLQVEVVATTTVEKRFLQSRPDAMLLILSATEVENLTWLNTLTTHQPTIPLFVIETLVGIPATMQLQQRIKMAQLGGKGFWQAPINPSSILETIVEEFQAVVATTAKILMVDDDLAMLEKVQQILHPWGFELTLSNDSQQFWEMLEQTQPDLVILDIEMPEVNGIELCQVIRQDGQWSELPVLFLSAHTDDATLQKIFMVGADDYISKPVRAVELVLRVLRRLEQARLLKRLYHRSQK
ncbi:MAG: response regulator [Actinomycetota bacterium]